MNEQQTFLDAAKKYEAIVEDLKKAREELDAAMTALGYNTFVQDEETRIVYQVVKPNGKFVFFSDMDYIRTKKKDEKQGSLSAKKAQEAGFILE